MRLNHKRKIKNMDEQLKSLIARVQQAQNVLVTVSSNPNVDQLAAAIGLTLALNKLGKHGTAVFSGEVPNTLEFLRPEETLEKNTDSLRDFIIALDKSKADKLRYKVEDQVVRIFITPYRTSINQDDLDFSQGDFNVDVVVCLGVGEQADLDSAITAHGRILHDATVTTIGTEGANQLGTINWADPGASSLSEMVLALIDNFDKKLLDSQMATALLTGIVANTDRFRNEKTSPKAMSASAELMAAGANQQLIASELEQELVVAQPPAAAPADEEEGDDEAAEAETPKKEPGTLEIEHEAADAEAASEPEPVAPEPPEEPAQPVISQVHIDEHGGLTAVQPPVVAEAVTHDRLTEPPTLGNASITANTQPESLDPSTESLTQPPSQSPPLLSHNETVLQSVDTPPEHPADPTPEDPPVPREPLPAPPAPPDASVPPTLRPPAAVDPDETLSDIEASVHSPHLQAGEQSATEVSGRPESPASASPTGDLDSARNAVDAALSGPSVPPSLPPIEALNAQPLGPELQPPGNEGFNEPTPGNTPADETLDMPLPSSAFPVSSGTSPGGGTASSSQGNGGQLPPPPVPPPMLPPLQ